MYLEYFVLGSCALLLLSFPIMFSAMFKKLDAAERYMQYSSYIVGCRHTFRNAPFEGRPQRVYAMATVILIPKVIQWRGMVLVEDVEKNTSAPKVLDGRTNFRYLSLPFRPHHQLVFY